ncbi:site-2 protease family protein [Virgibacillus kekensis]|uniref:Site-2 protease family protein n=1 Tax=Virgibacillus kekensis TaxID=202261 RepID=A0ABV9DK13_9BACI
MRLLKKLPAIRIHPILLIFIIVSFLTGTFVELMIILGIVFFHELGHYMMAAAFQWRIRGIMLWVFGGVMDTDEYGTSPLHEELLVTIAGPFQHLFVYMGLWLLPVEQMLPSSIIELIFFYNTVILLFNLLPVWPLDGGKIVFLILSAILPYRKAYNYVILFSLCTCFIVLVVQFFVIQFTMSSFMLFLFLLIENRTDWKQRYYVFLRFLLQRYYGNTDLKGIRSIEVSYDNKLIEVFTRFYRTKKHSIFVTYPDRTRLPIDEMDCLHSYFHKRQHQQSIGEIAESVS